MRIIFALFATSLYSYSTNAKSLESFNDSFGMEFLVQGKLQDVMARWNVICGRGCIIQMDELNCSDKSDYFNADHRIRSSDDGTLTVEGHWSRGEFKLSFKDGPEQWRCQFSVSETGRVKDAKCQATNQEKALVMRMPEQEVPWRDRCKNVRFRGKN